MTHLRSAPHPRPRRRVRPRVRGGGPRLGRPARPPPRSRREPAAGHDRERRHVPARPHPVRARDDRAQAARRGRPLWHCGTSPRSARVATELFDGWMPGRIAMRTLERRLQTIDDVAPRPGAAGPPWASSRRRSPRPDEEALAHVNIPGLLAWANKSRFAVRPASGASRPRPTSRAAGRGHARRRRRRVPEVRGARGRSAGVRPQVSLRPLGRAGRATRHGRLASARRAPGRRRNPPVIPTREIHDRIDAGRRAPRPSAT